MWVHRAAYEALVKERMALHGLNVALRDVAETMRQERDYLRTRSEHLTEAYTAQVDRMHGLVRDGYRPADTVPPALEVEADDLAPPIRAAIAARALDREMARDLEAWARAEVARGRDPDEAATLVWRGLEMVA
jgi:protein-disulfide isomerase-like protein with CxxC motif